MRKNYQKELKESEKIYDNALSNARRIQKNLQTIDQDHGLSLDLNKI